MKTDSSINATFEIEQKTKVLYPLFTCGVSAGFPSPAEDHIDRKLDLNELLIQHPVATFFVRVAGESMKDAGINHGQCNRHGSHLVYTTNWQELPVAKAASL